MCNIGVDYYLRISRSTFGSSLQCSSFGLRACRNGSRGLCLESSRCLGSRLCLSSRLRLGSRLWNAPQVSTVVNDPNLMTSTHTSLVRLSVSWAHSVQLTMTIRGIHTPTTLSSRCSVPLHCLILSRITTFAWAAAFSCAGMVSSDLACASACIFATIAAFASAAAFQMPTSQAFILRVTHPTPITKHSLLLLLLLLLHTYRTHPTPITLIFNSYYTLIILLLLHAYRTHASFKCTRVNNPSKTIQPQNWKLRALFLLRLLVYSTLNWSYII